MTHAQMRRARVRGSRMILGITAASIAFGVAATAANAQVEVPGRVGVTAAAAPAAAASPAAPSTPEAAPEATTPSGSTRTVAVRLSLGSRGAAVRELQRALRKRGLRVSVDGSFGPQTRRAVLTLQRRWKMAPTGVADTKLLKRLGLQTRRVASSTPAATTAPTGSDPYLSIFPVQGSYSYFDDYGAARHQGAHQGIDVMADKGTPLVAVADSSVNRLTRTESGLGGIYVWLKRADGTEYYYAHMASITPGLEAGDKVKAGQIIGTVGNTGDARYGAHHLHFEIRLAGNRIINPYTHLVAVDSTRNSSAARSR